MNNKIKKQISNLINWINKQIKNAKKDGVVIGISGGIDSACCLALCKQIKNIEIHTYYFYFQQNKEELKYINDLGKSFKIKINKINLSKSLKEIQSSIKIKNKLSLNNLKVRLRSICLYGIAQHKNLLVIGTSNADEIYVGYFTKFGDVSGDLAPIASLTKNNVYEISKYLKIPQSIINRTPSAGLYKGQTDEKELKVKYTDIDNYLLGKPISNAAKNRIEQLHKQTAHKRIFINKPECCSRYNKYCKN